MTYPLTLDSVDHCVTPLSGHTLTIGRDEVAAREAFPSLLEDGGLLGESPAMVELGQLLTKIAASDSTVLITGESGTGKELVARALHARSQRSAGPFVPVNCAAVPEALLESELFGHVKGAFTSAVTDKKGLFQQASAGTLFLDEIAEIQGAIQSKLLRALQEHTLRPVGATEERTVDVRLLAATNRPLEAEVEAGRFRRDLYYRVNVLTVVVPPLREREADVLLLARVFAREVAARAGRSVLGFHPDAVQALLSHDWPGNVRELQNCIERAVTLIEGDTIRAKDLGLRPAPAAAHERTKVLPIPILDSEDALPSLEELERRYIQHVLRRVRGNKTRAAELLGINRRTLHRKLHDSEPPAEPGVLPTRR